MSKSQEENSEALEEDTLKIELFLNSQYSTQTEPGHTETLGGCRQWQLTPISDLPRAQNLCLTMSEAIIIIILILQMGKLRHSLTTSEMESSAMHPSRVTPQHVWKPICSQSGV